ncbi:putative fucosyl transferase [uncultured Gammaproteobacteria bacterium]|jgi:hypothetical protein|nr:putative fucosyl transferase [uncultured Gammaproteobacteria bacterium]
MKKACIVVSSVYQNNQLFDLSNPTLNRDNCLFGFYLLKQEFKKYNIDLSTYDINHPNDSDVVIYNEIPKKVLKNTDKNKSYLLIFESELIRLDNWSLEKHKYFGKIFTWNDKFVDNKKYFKLNFSHLLPKNINKDMSKKNKLCTMIAGNKKIKHPLELYSKREESIRWFEKYHPDDFDLYGREWDIYAYQNRYIEFLFRKIKLNNLFKANFPSYKGRVDSKKNTLEKYKFSICYENAKDIPGYITEKIFDCFLAGCVPIYWGANNITDHIPSNCFIDKRKFNTYEKLYQYISNMSDDEYVRYLDNIEIFFNSDSAKQFTHQYFVKTIVSNVGK